MHSHVCGCDSHSLDCSGLAKRARLQGALRFLRQAPGVLVEAHNLPELEVAHRIGAEIIGVNNRNFGYF